MFITSSFCFLFLTTLQFFRASSFEFRSKNFSMYLFGETVHDKERNPYIIIRLVWLKTEIFDHPYNLFVYLRSPSLILFLFISLHLLFYQSLPKIPLLQTW